jgi:hypothetical protein
MPKHSPHVLELARRGAALRLQELKNEAELLLDLFPDLGDAFDPDELPVSFLVRAEANSAERGPVRRRKPWSAAARKAASRRMKQHWEKRRGEAKS